MECRAAVACFCFSKGRSRGKGRPLILTPWRETRGEVFVACVQLNAHATTRSAAEEVCRMRRISLYLSRMLPIMPELHFSHSGLSSIGALRLPSDSDGHAAQEKWYR